MKRAGPGPAAPARRRLQETVRPARARVRTHWFRDEPPRTAEDIAGAAAFIAWRIAHQVLRNMRQAAFEIEAGPRYFDFLAEWIIFLAQAADREAYARLAQERLAFTSFLANRLGEHLAGNRKDLLGEEDEAACKSLFIDLFNLRLADYIDFGADETGRSRYLAQRLAQSVGADDRLWIHEQVMEIEAPAALQQMQSALGQLLGDDPRPRRSASAGGE